MRVQRRQLFDSYANAAHEHNLPTLFCGFPECSIRREFNSKSRVAPKKKNKQKNRKQRTLPAAAPVKYTQRLLATSPKPTEKKFPTDRHPQHAIDIEH